MRKVIKRERETERKREASTARNVWYKTKRYNYLFWFLSLWHFDLIFSPRCRLTLGWNPLNDRDPCGWFDSRRFWRSGWSRQYQFFRFRKELCSITRRGRDWGIAVFLALRPGQNMTPASVWDISTKDTRDKSSRWRTSWSVCRLPLRGRRRSRTATAKRFRGRRTIIIRFLAIYKSYCYR